MKKTIKVICLFLLINVTYSCTTPEPDPGLIGEYEYFVESTGEIINVRIISTTSGLSWANSVTGLQPITLVSDLEFSIPPFEVFGFINIIEGDLQENELHVTQNIFELDDLETPVTKSKRIYIRKK